jgi:hypothetical protein
MPPYLAPPYFSLSRLPPTTKVGLSCFYVMILGALAFAAFGVFRERTQFDADRTHANFAGYEVLPREKQTDPLPARLPARHRMDIIHPHSFLMPILFFILLHLMEMTRAPRGAKLSLYLAGFAGTVGVVLAPWLAYESRAGAVVTIAAVVAQLGSFGLMIVVPVVEMWGGSSEAGKLGSP